jgi:hypothetical protein
MRNSGQLTLVGSHQQAWRYIFVLVFGIESGEQGAGMTRKVSLSEALRVCSDQQGLI